MYAETSNTLLNSLKQADPQAPGWYQLVENYEPFIHQILRRQGVSRDAAEDVVQNVMAVVVRRLPEFERRRIGSFRSWLRTITANCLRDYRKTKRNAELNGEGLQELIKAMHDPASQLTRIWNRQHARHTLEMLLDSVADEFTPQTIEAFRRLAIEEQPTTQVACDLGISPNACLIARSRVLTRLRRRIGELQGDANQFFEFET